MDDKAIPFYSSMEFNKFSELVKFFFEVKKLILFSEELDPKSKVNVIVWKELRDALDHLMRIFNDVINNSAQRGKEYCNSNLDKVEGHLCRAAFDALDGSALLFRNFIKDIALNYSHQVLIDVFPGYWEYRKRLEIINNQITTIREKKDFSAEVNLIPLTNTLL